MITLRYFASLSEALGESAEEHVLDGALLLSELRLKLASRGHKWRALEEDKQLLIAVNQVLVNIDMRLNDGDEVAFFPPVTGG